MMTKPLIDHLVSFKDTQITIASNMPKAAAELVKKHPEFLKAVELDVTNIKEVLAVVTGQDVVISFIPPWMHPHVLEPCL